jgi:hypothetical protein
MRCESDELCSIKALWSDGCILSSFFSGTSAMILLRLVWCKYFFLLFCIFSLGIRILVSLIYGDHFLSEIIFFFVKEGDYIKTNPVHPPLYRKNLEKFGNYRSNPKTTDPSRRRRSKHVGPPPSTARGPKHCCRSHKKRHSDHHRDAPKTMNEPRSPSYNG